MTTTQTNQREAIRPSLIAYHVPETVRGQKAHWHRIGAAFAQRDGKGFSVMLNSLPLNWDGRLVLREPIDNEEIADADMA